MDLTYENPSRAVLRAILVALVALALPAGGIALWLWSATTTSYLPAPSQPSRPGVTFLGSEAHGVLTIETWRTFGWGCCDGDGIVHRCVTQGLDQPMLIPDLGSYSISPGDRFLLACDGSGRSTELVDLTSGAVVNRWDEPFYWVPEATAWTADSKRAVRLLVHDKHVFVELLDSSNPARPAERSRATAEIHGFSRYGFPACSWSPANRRFACLVYPLDAGNYERLELLEFDSGDLTAPPRRVMTECPPGIPRIEWDGDRAQVRFAVPEKH